jgi:monofunctional biosynthetic peptidoglycan transglycosylase
MAQSGMARKRTLPQRVLRWLCLATLGGIVLSVAVVLLLRFVAPPTSAFMIDRRIDAWLDEERDFRLDYRWTPIAQVSAQLPIALVAAEDQTFPDHHGFDVAAIQSAMAEAEDGSRLRGASTITQQVAKNLFLWNGRSYVRKGLEAYFTVLIEVLWPKQRIIEVYLNIAEFGDGIYGADAAARRFFGVDASRLSARQAALLAAVLPNPQRMRANPPSPYVQRRAAWIERQVRQLGGPAYLTP